MTGLLKGTSIPALAEVIARTKAQLRTVVVITQKPQLLAHIDCTLVLAGRRVQAFGERAEILARLSDSVIHHWNPLLPQHHARVRYPWRQGVNSSGVIV